MPKKKLVSGVIDPISLIGVLLLIVTLVVGTKVASDKGFSLNIIEQAAKSKKTGNKAYDECREDSGRKKCNEKFGINVNWKGEVVNEIDTSNVDKNAKPGDPTCDANGTKYSPGAVVMYGGIGSNATCGEDGKWNVGVGATKDIKPENLPEYAKESDKLKKQIEDEEAVAEAEKQVIQEQEKQDLRLEKVQEVVIPTQNKDDVYVPSIKPVVTTSQINLADITAGVTSGTIPSSSKPYVPPLLPTVPTAEDLLRKLPGLEKLQINDIKKFNYSTSPQEENKKIFNWPKLEGLGTYGLGGGNAYIAPVPMNIINSGKDSDFYNYAIGNTVSAGAGFASATLVTPGAPAFVFETITAVPGAIKALTLSDLADTAVTGAMCAQGNQEACAAFTATALIPGPTGSVNLITDSIEDFATSWAGTGSVVNKIINNIPSPALSNPSSSFDNFTPTQTVERFANTQELGLIADLEAKSKPVDMLFAPANQSFLTQAVPNADEILNAMAPHAPIGNPIPTTLDTASVNPLTSVVDNSFVKNLPSDFQAGPNIVDFTNGNSIPPATEITIPQKFTNWAKAEMAKTNPNAFLNGPVGDFLFGKPNLNNLGNDISSRMIIETPLYPPPPSKTNIALDKIFGFKYGARVSIDPSNDVAYSNFLKGSEEYINRYSGGDREKVELVTDYVTDAFPNYNLSDAQSGKDVKNWVDSIYDRGDLLGENIPIGKFIETGCAVCKEQAIVLQTSLAYNGIESTINGGQLGKSGNWHAWVEYINPEDGKIWVADPVWKFNIPRNEAEIAYGGISNESLHLDVIARPTNTNVSSPPLTGISKFQEQVGSFGQKVMDGSLPTGVGISPLKYVAGGIASAVFLDDYFDLGIMDKITNWVSITPNKDDKTLSPSQVTNNIIKTEEKQNINNKQNIDNSNPQMIPLVESSNISTTGTDLTMETVPKEYQLAVFLSKTVNEFYSLQETNPDLIIQTIKNSELLSVYPFVNLSVYSGTGGVTQDNKNTYALYIMAKAKLDNITLDTATSDFIKPGNVFSSWYGYKDHDRFQITQCVLWQNLLDRTFPELNIAKIGGFTFDDSGKGIEKAQDVFKLIKDSNNYSIIDGGKLYQSKAGGIQIMSFDNINNVEKGDTCVYGNHMCTILDKYKQGNKLYFLISEANSPNGKLDGTPQTYLVDEAGFINLIGLKNTLFLRSNTAYLDSSLQTPTQLPESFLAPTQIASQNINLPKSLSEDSVPPTAIVNAAFQQMKKCVPGQGNNYNACEGEYYNNEILKSTSGINNSPWTGANSIYELYWCTQLVYDAAESAGLDFKYKEYSAYKLHKDMQENQAVTDTNLVDFNKKDIVGQVAFVSTDVMGSVVVVHVGIVSEVISTNDATYVTVVQANSPSITTTYELDKNGKLVYKSNTGSTLYIENFGNLETYAKNQ